MRFVFDKEVYQFKKLPMGLRMSPAVAHNYLVHFVRDFAAANPNLWRWRVHIDDILLIGDRH